MKLKFLLLIGVTTSTLTDSQNNAAEQISQQCQTASQDLIKAAQKIADMITATNKTLLANNFQFLGVINFLQAITGPTQQTTDQSSLFSFAAQKDANGNYICPNYNFSSLLSQIQPYSCKGCQACNGQLLLANNMFTLNGQTCQINCGTAACSPTNNLMYQVNPDNGYIYNPNVIPPTGLFAQLFPNDLCDANQVYYTPVGCQCSGFELSLDQLNNARSFFFGANNSSGANNSLIMQCPICTNFYQATNTLILVKYQVLNALYALLHDTTALKLIDATNTVTNNTNGNFVTNSIQTYCANNPTTAGCDKIKILSNPLLPQSRNLNVPWQYVLNSQNQCTANGTPPSNTTSSNYCLLVDSNKIYTAQDIFNFLNLVAQALTTYWTSLQANLKAVVERCIKDAATQLEVQTLSQKQTILNEQQELINEQKSINAMSEVNQKLGLTNNILMVGMFAYQLLMPKAIQQVISSAYEGLINGIKNGIAKGVDNIISRASATLFTQVGENLAEDASRVGVEAAAKVMPDATIDAVRAASTTVERTLPELADIASRLSLAGAEVGAQAGERLAATLAETLLEAVPK